MNGASPAPHRPWLAVLVMLCAGCSAVEAPAGESYAPAVVEEVPGQDVLRIRFTADAAHRVALETARVRSLGSALVVPYAALIYDSVGGTWVYAQQPALTFVRAKVVVAKIDGEHVHLDAGPPVGTEVVTTGAAEVYGAELGIDGGH